MFLILIVVTISLVVPEVAKAQEVKPNFLLEGSIRRGFVISAGMVYADESNEEFSMEAHASWSYPNSSFGLTCIVRPIKGKAGQLFGFGVEGLYFFKAKVSSKSHVANGASGSSLVTDPQSYWRTTGVGVIPTLEISVPIKKWRLGITGQPFAFGTWNYYYKDDRWSDWKQYYSLNFYVSFHL